MAVIQLFCLLSTLLIGTVIFLGLIFLAPCFIFKIICDTMHSLKGKIKCRSLIIIFFIFIILSIPFLFFLVKDDWNLFCSFSGSYYGGVISAVSAFYVLNTTIKSNNKIQKERIEFDENQQKHRLACERKKELIKGISDIIRELQPSKLVFIRDRFYNNQNYNGLEDLFDLETWRVKLIADMNSCKVLYDKELPKTIEEYRKISFHLIDTVGHLTESIIVNDKKEIQSVLKSFFDKKDQNYYDYTMHINEMLKLMDEEIKQYERLNHI